MSILVLAILIALILAVIPVHGYSANWGYGPSGGLGLLVVIIIVLLLLGRI